ncbi:MAG: NifB/NifX family molybdenum-iron cluster-binding protein [bacterium]|nr:NifB/NifX family molybdenum-iron cluster-binding protein [bacterium]
MKIAVSSTGNDLESAVDPRFGRCGKFIIIDKDSGNFEVVENPNATAGGGAGIQTAQLVADKGVEVVLTGNVGPNAFRTLEAAGIKIFTGIEGTVKSAIEKYNSGALNDTKNPTKQGHWQ